MMVAQPLVALGSVSVATALERLKRALPNREGTVKQLRSRLPLSPWQAMEYLHRLESVFYYHDLFELYFPVDYAAASRKPFTWGGTESLEMQFLTLVNEHMFPISLEWASDVFDMDGEWPDTILVELQTVFPDDAEYEESYKLPIRVIASLVEIMDADSHWADIAREIGVPVPELIRPDWGRTTLHSHRFQQLCKISTAHPNMADVPVAFQVIAHGTGNFWLDTTEEMLSAYFLGWTQDNVAWLVDEWREAKATLDRFGVVIDWLLDEPQHYAEIIRYWNDCVVERSVVEAERE